MRELSQVQVRRMGPAARRALPEVRKALSAREVFAQGRALHRLPGQGVRLSARVPRGDAAGRASLERPSVRPVVTPTIRRPTHRVPWGANPHREQPARLRNAVNLTTSPARRSRLRGYAYGVGLWKS